MLDHFTNYAFKFSKNVVTNLLYSLGGTTLIGILEERRNCKNFSKNDIDKNKQFEKNLRKIHHLTKVITVQLLWIITIVSKLNLIEFLRDVEASFQLTKC